LDKALAQFRIEVGHFPTTEQGLAALLAAPAGESKWNGPYLSKALPADPWGRAYLYKCCPGEHGDFDLYSFGKDGVAGGSGEQGDITNWAN
jgi:general secretion pathway protein G